MCYCLFLLMIHDPVWSDTDTDAADFLYFPAHTTAMVSAFVDYAFGDQGCAPFAAADEDHIPFPDDLLLDLPPLLEVTDSGLLLADNLAFLLQKHLDTEAHDCSCPQDPAGFCDLIFEEVAADIITVYDSGFSLPDPALPLGGDHTPHTAPDQPSRDPGDHPGAGDADAQPDCNHDVVRGVGPVPYYGSDMDRVHRSKLESTC